MILEVKNLTKRFGSNNVLRGISFSAPSGSILAILGPNGAGKTTLINCLTTLITPDGGKATIAEYDVAKQPELVRSLIGFTGQFSAIDEELTARENLIFFGRLLKLSHGEAKKRSTELLEQFDLFKTRKRRVKTFSGGMRRRLDLAAGIVAEPLVLFLDEPTTGLDPRSRRQLWQVVSELKSRGITIILTTQYLEEADALADRIIVIDRGVVIAEGSSNDLKDRVGGYFCEFRLLNFKNAPKIARLLADFGDISSIDGQGSFSLAAPDGVKTLAEVVYRLNNADISLADISLRRPSLDDVFFALTGNLATQEPCAENKE